MQPGCRVSALEAANGKLEEEKSKLAEEKNKAMLLAKQCGAAAVWLPRSSRRRWYRR